MSMFSFMKKEPELPPIDPTLVLAEAQECLKEKDFDSALEKFDLLCSLSVQSPLPLLSRATCRLQLKKYEGVLEDCEKVLMFLNSDINGHEEESCTTVHSLALMRMAKAHKELGNLDSAKSSLMRKNAIEHKLGRNRVDDDGDEAAEDMVEKERQTAEEWKEKGNAEYRKENWTLALEFYKNGLGYDMYNAKLHSNTCMTLIKLRRWSQALKHAEQCIALEPDWVKGYYMKGMILSGESKIEQALVVLRQAAKMEPGNTQIKALLDEVESRVEYVESRLRRRKPAKDKEPEQPEQQKADDSGNDNDNKRAVEDVDSDEEYCDDDGCRTPRKIKLKVTRADVINTAMELAAAAVGVAVVWWFVTQRD
ncbi:hypothetical protein GGI01_002217 [Coemansia sp. RSA 376]|nr:hypothetical protein IW146_001774 [Coemansia sp. RSA 922]KAJ2261529.1 hypothetical protein GGI01_002217 [Coemansia sp. RSA 376]